ncbi:enoyl-CoA hydratase-related protein [Aquabacter sp. CN5-332]|uniref:enoyl-CoA hydratase/isomerase family protein n=1 Tax=Aquabacter sp. CN5-332 TaxID=3156608 RepID=UPI0032B52774
METDTIRFDVDGDGVATLLLNRPEKLNAFDRTMLERWNEALLRSMDDEAVKVIVLTGAGRAFCAGGDAGNMQKRAESPENALDRKDYLFRLVHTIALTMERLDKPVIAAINGAARGAGLDMALMCDIRVCTESATVAESYINLGLAAGDGGAWYLARLIGPDRALELLWTGRAVGAQEALELGLVTRVVPDDQLLPATYELARRIAAQSQPAIRMSKRIFYQSVNLPLVTHLDMVSSHMAVLRDTPEYRAKLAEVVARTRKS